MSSNQSQNLNYLQKIENKVKSLPKTLKVCLKNLDMFKVDQSFNTSEGGSSDRIGSRVGGVFTLAFIIIFAYNTISSFKRMHYGIDDSNVNKSRINYLKDGENIIHLNDSSFLPNIEFVDWFGDP